MERAMLWNGTQLGRAVACWLVLAAVLTGGRSALAGCSCGCGSGTCNQYTCNITCGQEACGGYGCGGGDCHCRCPGGGAVNCGDVDGQSGCGGLSTCGCGSVCPNSSPPCAGSAFTCADNPPGCGAGDCGCDPVCPDGVASCGGSVVACATAASGCGAGTNLCTCGQVCPDSLPCGGTYSYCSSGLGCVLDCPNNLGSPYCRTCSLGAYNGAVSGCAKGYCASPVRPCCSHGGPNGSPDQGAGSCSSFCWNGPKPSPCGGGSMAGAAGARCDNASNSDCCTNQTNCPCCADCWNGTATGCTLGDPTVTHYAQCSSTAGWSHYVGSSTWKVVCATGFVCCGTNCDFNNNPFEDGCNP